MSTDITTIDWSAELLALRAAFGEAPRRFGWLRRYALRIPRPRWLVNDERPELAAILQHQELLWSQGEVLWGAVITASEGLLKPGIDDLPAVVLYSWEQQCQGNLLGLVQAAQQLVQLSQAVNLAEPDTQTKPSLLPILQAPTASDQFDPFARLNQQIPADQATGLSPRARLKQELAAPRHYAVPPALTAMVPMLATTIFVRRLHLPQRRLTNGYLPLLVERTTGVATIFPCRYWTKTILADWQQAATSGR